MLKHKYTSTIFLCTTIFLFSVNFAFSQTPKDSTAAVNDSIKKANFLNRLGNGFFPTKFLDIDLRYLVKFNQYEGLRSGLGGQTSSEFSDKYRLNAYLVYGFVDKKSKYSIGGGVRVAPKTNTWINLSYTDDLQETGSTQFILDKRFFQFFEPRLLNIDLFHKHITTKLSVEHEISPKLLTETQFSTSNISPTYSYNFEANNDIYHAFEVSLAKVAFQYNPFDKFDVKGSKQTLVKSGFPKFTLQYTKSFKDVFGADFNFSKVDFRTIQKFNHKNNANTLVTFTAGFAHGDTPLTHLYHAYPNNIRKETILQRFSVAGINSFETMFFNEFFSDRFTTFIVKHYFAPFKITERYQPQLVLISRYALGNMNNINRHQNLDFNTLNKGYTETGFEINKLLFGFGLSATYRYGAYHLPKEEDNVAVKFTFNITL